MLRPFECPRLALLGCVAVAFGFVVLRGAPAESQGGASDRFRQMSATSEKQELAEPFKGITATGEVEPGLFAIRATGVSTEPVRKAADAFLAALTPAQHDKTVFPLDDPEWRKWMNQHFYIRQGVSFEELGESQRGAGVAHYGKDLLRQHYRQHPHDTASR
jgi:hypothetical protein